MESKKQTMKVFLDTNIFIEFFEQRAQFHIVGKILDAIEDGKIEAFVSTGSIYTMTYLLTQGLKRNNIHRPEQTEKLRETLLGVTHLCHVIDISHQSVIHAVENLSFTDLEDSYQFQCAKQNGCSHLITINTRDYKNAFIPSLEIISPTDFVNQYLSENP